MPDPPRPRRATLLRFLLLLAIVAAGIVAFRFTPLRAYADIAWIRAQLDAVRARWWAGPAYALLYMAGCLVAFPGSPMSVAGALAFGPWWGILWVVLGSNLGLNATFGVARALGRGWMDEKLKGGRLEQLNARLAEKGLLRVMQLRLIPVIPFNLLNYACGLTQIRWRDYAIGSFLGMLPLNIIYVYFAGILGEALLSTDSTPEARRARWTSIGAALAFFALVSLVPLLVRVLRRRPAERETVD